MNLESLRGDRVSRHQKKMTRYLKYVFNDHFVIVLLFLLGAAGYFYSNFLKQADTISFFLLISGCLLLALMLLPGDIATLVEPADTVFLTPLENEMHTYLNKMKNRSLVLPFLLEGAMVASMMPLFVAGNSLTFGDTLFFVLTAWLLKASDLEVRLVSFTYQKETFLLYWKIILFLLGSFIFASSLFFSPFLGPILGFLVLVSVKLYIKKEENSYSWNWEEMIRHESKRLSGHYRLLNLFTDVPLIETTIKRNLLFEKITALFFHTNRLKKENQNPTFDFLFQTVFTRNPDYRNLYVRLLFLSFLVQIYSPFHTLSILMALVFLYAIGFQLIPLFNHFRGNVSTILYPISEKEKQQSLSRVIGTLLGVTVFVQSISGFIMMGLKAGSLSLILQLLFCVLFLKISLPKRTTNL